METPVTYQKSSKVDSSDCRLEWLVLSQVPLIRGYLGDCMDLMASTADNHYDLVLADPPYGNKDAIDIKNSRNHSANRKEYRQFKNIAPNIKYFDELRRVSKNQIIWGGNWFGIPGGYICWNKNGTLFGEAELAYNSMINSVRIYEYTWNGMIQQNMSDKEQRIHPTQKPVALYRWLLKNYVKAGQRILDTHGGSFSSAVACHTEGFEMDIIEIDEEYYNAGIKRFKEATCQLKIF